MGSILGQGDDITCNVNNQYHNCTNGPDIIYLNCQVASHSESLFYTGSCEDGTAAASRYTTCSGSMVYSFCAVGNEYTVCTNFNKET